MKLHAFPIAPNPTKVKTYLAEKGLEIPIEIVDLIQGEQKRPGFLARNPLGKLPVLELDDGSLLTESLAIIEYLEELHPDPPLIGPSGATAPDEVTMPATLVPWPLSSSAESSLAEPSGQQPRPVEQKHTSSIRSSERSGWSESTPCRPPPPS